MRGASVVCLSLAVLLSVACGCQSNPYGLDPPAPSYVDIEPDWSPDGITIAYTHVDRSGPPSSLHQVWLLDVEPMTTRFLTDGRLPVWAPDGKMIAFVRNTDIYVIDLETAETTRLTDWGQCFYPSWSPEGSRIAFDTNHDDPRGANAIWIMNSDGSNPVDISVHGTGEWRMPAWSPDGSQILHIRYLPGGDPDSELFVMDTSGGNASRLTEDSFNDRDPCWSPDGSRIAWSRFGEGLANPLSGVWVMNADGTDEHQLTTGCGATETFAYSPSWSPDGTQIVYAGYNQDSHTYTLWLINADGTNQHRLTTP